MARNEGSSSVPDGKTANRPLAARMKPAAGEPDPRDLHGDKRNCGPAAGELTGLRVDEGKGAAPIPYVFIPCSGRDEPAPSTKNGHARRCYDEMERLQVAETRKRGACKPCKESKTKCNHDPSKIPDYQIESYELFALGLTTPSLNASRDGHKHVMEEKIAEINNTFAKAQENISEQNGEASADVKAKAAAKAVTQSPPELAIARNIPSQKTKQPPKVCHQQVRPQPAQFKRGLGSFRLEDRPKRKRGNPSGPKKDSTTATTNGASGMRNLKTQKTACGLQPVVCQQRSTDSAITTLPTIRPSTTTSPAKVYIEIHQTVPSCSTSTYSKEQHGCKALQASVAGLRSTALVVAPLVLRLEGRVTRRPSGSSDQGSHATTPDESLSYGRSLSPSSDHLPSEPRAYVHLTEVENIQQVFNIPQVFESIEKLLYEDDINSLDGVYDPTPGVSETVNIRSLATVTEIPEDDTGFLSGMDLDDDDF